MFCADVGLNNCHPVNGKRIKLISIFVLFLRKVFHFLSTVLPVSGESARLVRADGCGVPHRLAGVQVAHKVVVAHHFLHFCISFLENDPISWMVDQYSVVHDKEMHLTLTTRLEMK